MNKNICLITCSYSGDFQQFSFLRESIQNSKFKDAHHVVTVESEDLPLFRTLDDSKMTLQSTQALLPEKVEKARTHAKKNSTQYGRRASRIAGSLCRHLKGAQWPQYTGWHTQQISKLLMAANSTIDNVIVLDSDVIVFPNASPESLINPRDSDRITCFSDRVPQATIKDEKVKKWNQQAAILFGQDNVAIQESYFDTPFIFHAPTVRKMFEWLENQYQKPWWQVLLEQPARRWSEFATYRTYLRHIEQDVNVLWKKNIHSHYIYDAYNASQVTQQVAKLIKEPSIYFLTLHSQASGKAKWNTGDCIDSLRPILKLANPVT